MKKISILFLLACSLFTSKAQVYYPDGTVISSTVSVTDINDATYDLFSMTDAGKHVIFNMSSTLCPPCRSYHQSGVLDKYWEKYGPKGTSGIKDAEVFLYEVNASTSMTAQRGSTPGNDWVAGVKHPVCNPANYTSVVSKFVQPGHSYAIPAIFVVCSDKKLYRISSSIKDENTLRTFISGVCGATPASETATQDLGFTYDIYPNPASSNTTIHLDLETEKTVTYSLKNSLGQTVTNTVRQYLNSGANNLDINTSNLTDGFYFVSLQVGDRNVNARILVAH